MMVADELRASLEQLFAAGTIELRESNRRTTPIPRLSWEVRGEPAKPLLHLWAENCNVTRRVLSIVEHADERIILDVERFGRTSPERLEIVRLNFERSPKKISREDFCEQLRRILAEKFPDETVDKLSITADLEHSLSGMYVRGISRKGSSRGAFLAVPESESQDAIENSLTYALLWLERARHSSAKGHVSFLRLILPAGKSPLLVHQLASLDPRLPVQVYELNSRFETVEPVDPCGDGNIKSSLVPLRESELLLSRAKPDLTPFLELAPHAVSVHPATQDKEVILRFFGLPFLRWQDGSVHFWNGQLWRPLSPRTQRELQQSIQKLKDFRNPLASDLQHPLYRAHPERWMQSLVSQDIARIDITLDPEHVYEQVIAKSAGQHGVLDLLTVTRTKRLAILELKAAENPQLPLQAADYWERIRRHHAQGDLKRYGYFPQIELQSAPPILYLVAPALRFHPTTETLLKYLSPQIEIVRVGLAESWRRGLRVVMRH